MKKIIEKDYQSLSEKAALLIKEEIEKNPSLVLGLATGSTPLGLYKKLIEMNKKGEVDFSQVTTFNLDEYLGISSSHPQSYNYYMHKNFFDEINIKKENVFIPHGETENPEEHCKWYEKKIEEKGGIDLQILGIGGNGHIGFNEPGSSFSSSTRVVSLSKETIEDNSRFFEKKEEVPKKAITMGIETILKSKRIILLSSGENKKEAVKKAFKGKVTEEVPASVLQTHSRVTFLLDEKAEDF